MYIKVIKSGICYRSLKIVPMETYTKDTIFYCSIDIGD